MYKVTGIPLKSTAVFLFNSIYPDSHSHPPAFLIFVWLLISVPLPHIWAREDSFIYSVLKHLLKKKKTFIEFILYASWGFPNSSFGKESACNSGDPGSIPESGRSAGEGIGYPLQYSWASSPAQLVKNLCAMWENWVRPLGWEGPLEKGKATHSSTLAWRIPWGPKELDKTEQLSLSVLYASYKLPKVSYSYATGAGSCWWWGGREGAGSSNK